MKLSTLQALRAARRAGRPVVLATWLRSDEQRLFYGSTASESGSASGSASESESGSAPSPTLAEAIARVLREDRAEVLTTPDGELLLEPSNPPLRLLLVGAVHISHPLAAMAQLAGFAVTVVDPRRAFATAERFPGLALVVRWPDEAVRQLAPDARTAIVTLTHDPKLDDPALEVALTTPAFYIGCLGSKKTHATRLERLRARFDEAALARLRGPVGLAIGARSPAEIAVSILAQIVAALRGAPA